MEVSQVLRTSSFKTCFSQFSPNGKYLAYIINYSKLLVYSLRTNSIQHEYHVPETVEEFAWSPDSNFIVCSSLTHAAVHAYSLEHPDWRCNIDVGDEGLEATLWSPDSRHLLTIMNLSLWAYVWPLSRRKVCVIEQLKRAYPTFAFSPDGQYLAVVSSQAGEETIMVLCTTTWKTMKELNMDLKDIEGVAWNPDSDQICAWENPSGRRLGVYHIDGHRVAAHEIDCTISFAQWSEEFLCVACTDNSILLINGITWNVISKLHLTTDFNGLMSCGIFEEVQLPKCAPSLELISKALASALRSTDELLVSTDVQYLKVREYARTSMKSESSDDSEEGATSVNLRNCGISHMIFSSGTHFLASRSFGNPHMVWIWEVVSLKLTCVLIHQSPITCMVWEPNNQRLLICTSSQPSPHIYIWTPEGPSAIPMPKLGIDPLVSAQWHPTRKGTLQVNSHKRTIICTFDEKEGSCDTTSSRTTGRTRPHTTSEEGNNRLSSNPSVSYGAGTGQFEVSAKWSKDTCSSMSSVSESMGTLKDKLKLNLKLLHSPDSKQSDTYNSSYDLPSNADQNKSTDSVMDSPDLYLPHSSLDKQQQTSDNAGKGSASDVPSSTESSPSESVKTEATRLLVLSLLHSVGSQQHETSDSAGQASPPAVPSSTLHLSDRATSRCSSDNKHETCDSAGSDLSTPTLKASTLPSSTGKSSDLSYRTFKATSSRYSSNDKHGTSDSAGKVSHPANPSSTDKSSDLSCHTFKGASSRYSSDDKHATLDSAGKALNPAIPSSFSTDRFSALDLHYQATSSRYSSDHKHATLDSAGKVLNPAIPSSSNTGRSSDLSCRTFKGASSRYSSDDKHATLDSAGKVLNPAIPSSSNTGRSSDLSCRTFKGASSRYSSDDKNATSDSAGKALNPAIPSSSNTGRSSDLSCRTFKGASSRYSSDDKHATLDSAGKALNPAIPSSSNTGRSSDLSCRTFKGASSRYSSDDKHATLDSAGKALNPAIPSSFSTDRFSALDLHYQATSSSYSSDDKNATSDSAGKALNPAIPSSSNTGRSSDLSCHTSKGASSRYSSDDKHATLDSAGKVLNPAIPSSSNTGRSIDLSCRTFKGASSRYSSDDKHATLDSAGKALNPAIPSSSNTGRSSDLSCHTFKGASSRYSSDDKHATLDSAGKALNPAIPSSSNTGRSSDLSCRTFKGASSRYSSDDKHATLDSAGKALNPAIPSSSNTGRSSDLSCHTFKGASSRYSSDDKHATLDSAGKALNPAIPSSSNTDRFSALDLHYQATSSSYSSDDKNATLDSAGKALNPAIPSSSNTGRSSDLSCHTFKGASSRYSSDDKHATLDSAGKALNPAIPSSSNTGRSSDLSCRTFKGASSRYSSDDKHATLDSAGKALNPAIPSSSNTGRSSDLSCHTFKGASSRYSSDDKHATLDSAGKALNPAIPSSSNTDRFSALDLHYQATSSRYSSDNKNATSDSAGKATPPAVRSNDFHQHTSSHPAIPLSTDEANRQLREELRLNLDLLRSPDNTQFDTYTVGERKGAHSAIPSSTDSGQCELRQSLFNVSRSFLPHSLDSNEESSLGASSYFPRSEESKTEASLTPSSFIPSSTGSLRRALTSSSYLLARRDNMREMGSGPNPYFPSSIRDRHSAASRNVREELMLDIDKISGSRHSGSYSTGEAQSSNSRFIYSSQSKTGASKIESTKSRPSSTSNTSQTKTGASKTKDTKSSADKKSATSSTSKALKVDCEMFHQLDISSKVHTKASKSYESSHTGKIQSSTTITSSTESSLTFKSSGKNNKATKVTPSDDKFWSAAASKGAIPKVPSSKKKHSAGKVKADRVRSVTSGCRKKELSSSVGSSLLGVASSGAELTLPDPLPSEETQSPHDHPVLPSMSYSSPDEFSPWVFED